MTKDEWKKWVKCTIYNKQKLKESNNCGCYYCFSVYTYSKIDDWCDRGETAICPKCGIDSVAPFDLNNHEEEMEILKAAHEIGFK